MRFTLICIAILFSLTCTLAQGKKKEKLDKDSHYLVVFYVKKCSSVVTIKMSSFLKAGHWDYDAFDKAFIEARESKNKCTKFEWDGANLKKAPRFIEQFTLMADSTTIRKI